VIARFAGRRRRAAAAAVALSLAGAVAAGLSAPASAQPSSAPTATAPAAIPISANAVRIIAHDGADRMWFDITGTPQAGPVALHFVNAGQYIHEMALMQMKKGVRLAQVKQALASDDPEAEAGKLLVDPAAEITAPELLGPGRTETVVTNRRAGRYVVICFLPGPDGMPHAMMGMVGAVRVHKATAPIRTIRINGTVRLGDHGIVLPNRWKHGGTFAVTNTGTAPHNFSLAKLNKGTSLPAMFGCVGEAFGQNAMVDTCPGTFAGGVSYLEPGQTAYLRVFFDRGRYGYVSAEGNDFQHGLAGVFTIR
jgi:uncharacterized cupredoxin-like copper-binding protein